MERYLHIASGLALTAPDGASLPGCMYYALGSADTDQVRRDALAAAAGKLGLEVPSKATKAEIAALIDKEAVRLFEADEAANAERPAHVAPKRPGGEPSDGGDDDGE